MYLYVIPSAYGIWSVLESVSTSRATKSRRNSAARKMCFVCLKATGSNANATADLESDQRWHCHVGEPHVTTNQSCLSIDDREGGSTVPTIAQRKELPMVVSSVIRDTAVTTGHAFA